MAFGFSPYEVGSLVRAERSLAAGWGDIFTGGRSVRRGATGIVKDVHPGVFVDRYTVEFSTGFLPTVCHRVRERDLKRLRSFAPARSYEMRRDVAIGVRTGLLILAIWAAIQTGWYFADGGSLDGLVVGVFNELLAIVLALVARLGPVLFMPVVAYVLIWRRRRSRTS